MTKENWRSEILCACTSGNGYSSAPDTTGGIDGTILQLTTGRDKVKMSVENKPRRYKEKKVHEPQVGGAFQRGL